MIFQPVPIHSFTTKAPQKVNVLQNEIQVSEAFDNSIESPQPIKKPYVCIWDTGATLTVISKNVIDGLGLQPSGKVNLHVVGSSDSPTEYETNTYLVNLYLPNNVVITAKAAESSAAGCDVLIGMDVISLGDFAVTNHNQKTTWTFRLPSCDEIDFVKEIEEYNKKFKSPEQRRKERNKRKAEKRINRY
jgi:hypothetical protein